MITEIVTFKLPKDMTREEVISKFQKTAPSWRDNPDLIRKNYLYDPDKGIAGGAYLWKDKAQAERWHGEDFRKKVKEIYGSEPVSQFFETPIVVDTAEGKIIQE